MKWKQSKFIYTFRIKEKISNRAKVSKVVIPFVRLR